jgi:5,10-methylenetetrahydromethanopterin reductase
MAIECWTSSRSLPGAATATARRIEDEGWSGLTFTDSQNLSGDPYVALTCAALATKRIGLGTGVTNPWTRHPAVTASAITCVDVESNGRAALGIGRGDSALAFLGLAPAPVDKLREYLRQLRTYLRGESLTMDEASASATHRIGASLPLASAPDRSRLEWVATQYAGRKPVPVFVVASGPKVISAAAELADCVTLALGANPERVRWGVELARGVRRDVGLAAYVNVVVDEDRERALAIGAGSVASFARFSAIHGTVRGPVAASDKAAWEAIPHSYQMTKHFQTGQQATHVSPAFAERFAILGPASYCIERLRELAALGVDRFHVVGASRDVDREVALTSHRRFVTEVMAKL